MKTVIKNTIVDPDLFNSVLNSSIINRNEYIDNQLVYNMWNIIEHNSKSKQITELLNTQNAHIDYTASEFIDVKKRLADLEKNQTLEEEKKIYKANMSILSEIGQLGDNWNNYGAEKFSQSLIFRCMEILSSLELLSQPEIFPTAQPSIQFEYEPDDNHYLEIEIHENNIVAYQRIDNEKKNFPKLTITETINLINAFQSK